MAAAGYKGETDNGNGYGIQDTEKRDRKRHSDTDSTLDIGNGFWNNG